MPTSLLTADPRDAPRLSIYLAATLYFEGSSTPVKIRNISAHGVLLESALAPPAGELVQLVRGALIVHALVAWSTGGRCGLKFSGCIDVEQWRANPSNSEQERVDDIIRLVKAGAVPLPVPPLTESNQDSGTLDPGASVSADLRRILDLLDDLSAVLANDPDIIARHAPALQNIDIAMQLIAAIEGSAPGHGRLDLEGSKLIGLRRSADQALRRAS